MFPSRDVCNQIHGHSYGPMHVEESTLERVIAGRIFTELHGGTIPYRQDKFVDLLEKGDITKKGIISSVSSRMQPCCIILYHIVSYCIMLYHIHHG
jgi:hypothetical protein